MSNQNRTDYTSEESLELVQKQFFEAEKWDLNTAVAEHVSKLEQLANRMEKLGGAIPESMCMGFDAIKTARLLTEEFRLQRQETEASKDSDKDEESTTALVLKRSNNMKCYKSQKRRCIGPHELKKEWLKNLEMLKEPKSIMIGNGKKMFEKHMEKLKRLSTDGATELEGGINGVRPNHGPFKDPWHQYK